jgi:hypothetical protein
MDGWTIGADVGGMLTGLSVLTATIVWTRGQWRDRQQRKAAIALRNWHGYLMPENAFACHVKLAEGADVAAGRIVLEVLERADGRPDPTMAEGMRRVIARDGMLSSVPTQDEYDFLKYLRNERGYGKGVLVR